MVTPRRAQVRPRVVRADGEAALLLEEEVLSLLQAGKRGAVALLGPVGSGKTTALEHLAAVVPADSGVRLFDWPIRPYQLREAARDALVVYIAAKPLLRRHRAVYRLAPWDRDSLIEYLLAVHRDHCASVMARLSAADHALFGGVPELWRIVLDRLAEDPSLPDARTALHRYVDAQLPDTDLLQRARSACLNAVTGGRACGPPAVEQLGEAGFLPGVVCVLRHLEVQRLLAAERMAADVLAGADCDFLALRLPRRLVRSVAELLARADRALERLGELVAGPSWGQALAASLLHAVDPAWRPEADQVPVLAGAYLDRVAWAGVRLAHANMCEADLRRADLSAAEVDQADLSGAKLRHARLTGASLHELSASNADLTGADLSSARGERINFAGARLGRANLAGAGLPRSSFFGADLSNAVLAGADLSQGDFRRAELRGADFSGANLQGAQLANLVLRHANFRGACLRATRLDRCDLEYMDLPGADLRQARLRNALLTGANLTGADLTGANLRGTGLGDVTLESACLRHADLRGATFHMGSSRSGLLFTPIASEGTRTGFYTDESEEHHFQAPEDIRKANLCGADLLGAHIDGVDFYLVDLRGALYDREQERYFRRCRAILGAVS
jgi:uncharacterized protein YjbI with pentapeptide repeats/energy-coupling factor transporter ATP-binding protein EcfA2